MIVRAVIGMGMEDCESIRTVASEGGGRHTTWKTVYRQILPLIGKSYDFLGSFAFFGKKFQPILAHVT